MNTTQRSLAQRGGFLHLLQQQCVFFALVVTVAVFAIIAPKFFSVNNMMLVLRQKAVIGLIACSMTLVLVGGNFDLSVGAIVSFSAVTVIQLFNLIGPLPAIVIVLAAGAAAGIISGFLVAYLKLNSMIVTLGMTGIIQACTYFISGGQNSVLKKADDSWFLLLGRSNLGIIPVISIVWLAAVVGYEVLLKKTVFGRRLLATGGNPDAGRFTGIRVEKLLATTFVLDGVMAAFAGIALASRIGSAQNAIGEGYEMDVVTAVILGGTSLNGGSGSVLKTCIGVLTLGVLSSGLTMLGLKYYYQWLANGLVILLVVLIDVIAKRQKRKGGSGK